MIHVLDRKVVGINQTLVFGSVANSLIYRVFIISKDKEDEIIYESEDFEDSELKFKEY